MIKYACGIALLLCFTVSFAQEPELLDWNEINHDFGEIKQGEKAEFKFVFTNRADHPVKLDNVKASCGCTTPNWTRDLVDRGKTGEISVSYNTARVGAFNKSVSVYYDSIQNPKVIYIKGNVLAPPPAPGDSLAPVDGNLQPAPPPIQAQPIDPNQLQRTPVQALPVDPDQLQRTPVQASPVPPPSLQPAPIQPVPVNPADHMNQHREGDGHNHAPIKALEPQPVSAGDQQANTSVVLPEMKAGIAPEKMEELKKKYTIPRGALSFDQMVKHVGDVTSKDTKIIEFAVANTSTSDVTFTGEYSAPAGFAMKFADNVLKPAQESVVIVSLDASKLVSLGGTFNERIDFKTNEAAPHDSKSVTVSGNYEKIWTEAEKNNSPKIEFYDADIDGGKIIEGEKFVYDFRFKNTGKSTLLIESAKASCGCTASAPEDKEVAPGAESRITASFDSKGRLGQQTKTITVKSNDISNPNVQLKFTVLVEKDPFHDGEENPAGFGE